ncbi:MAG: hypothetical protein JXR78_17385 [Victivallales bacterium]|nr:hypothetical protein [Victivallales bacterium]
MNNRTEWIYRAGWGVCMHFLAIPASTSDAAGLSSQSWNRRVNAFDVESLAFQLAEINAGYILLTIGQNSGYYCSPNQNYDRLVGKGFCSDRDLIHDLQSELARYNIPLIAYLPSNAPSGDANAMCRLDGIPSWDYSIWGTMNPERLASMADSDSRMRNFQHNWQDILGEWSRRWGKGVSGWWFDGCYFADKMYNFPDEPNFASFAAAARVGNQDAILAFNSGVKYPPVQISTEEDYTAGEINDPWMIPADCGQCDYNALYHVLSFAGTFWGAGPMRYSPGEMAAITAKIMNRGGVVTWDIPFDQSSGTLRLADLKCLKRFSQLLPPSRDMLPLPDAGLEIIEPPRCVWPQDHISSGRGRLMLSNGTTESRIWQIGGQPLSLEPGETHHIEVPLSPVGRYGDYNYYLESGEYRRTFPVIPWITGKVSEAFHAMPEIRFIDTDIGRIELACFAGCLHLRGEVFDEKIIQSDIPWMNSCIELFFVRDATVVQYFLVPADGVKPDVVSMFPDYKVVSDIAFRTFPLHGEGYRFEASLPFEYTGVSHDGMRMEIKLNVHNHYGFMHGLLFGVDKLHQVEAYKSRLSVHKSAEG